MHNKLRKIRTTTTNVQYCGNIKTRQASTVPAAWKHNSPASVTVTARFLNCDPPSHVAWNMCKKPRKVGSRQVLANDLDNPNNHAVRVPTHKVDHCSPRGGCGRFRGALEMETDAASFSHFDLAHPHGASRKRTDTEADRRRDRDRDRDRMTETETE